MTRSKVLIIATIIIGIITFAFAIKHGKRNYSLFYRLGPNGMCTMATLVPYTTNILDAEDFTPITQNTYYTTAVWGTCPYTIIYRATIDSI